MSSTWNSESAIPHIIDEVSNAVQKRVKRQAVEASAGPIAEYHGSSGVLFFTVIIYWLMSIILPLLFTADEIYNSLKGGEKVDPFPPEDEPAEPDETAQDETAPTEPKSIFNFDNKPDDLHFIFGPPQLDLENPPSSKIHVKPSHNTDFTDPCVENEYGELVPLKIGSLVRPTESVDSHCTEVPSEVAILIEQSRAQVPEECEPLLQTSESTKPEPTPRQTQYTVNDETTVPPQSKPKVVPPTSDLVTAKKLPDNEELIALVPPRNASLGKNDIVMTKKSSKGAPRSASLDRSEVKSTKKESKGGKREEKQKMPCGTRTCHVCACPVGYRPVRSRSLTWIEWIEYMQADGGWAFSDDDEKDPNTHHKDCKNHPSNQKENKKK